MINIIIMVSIIITIVLCTVRKADASSLTYNSENAADTYRLVFTYDTSFYDNGNVADWNSATPLGNRLYAVQATVAESKQDLFTQCIFG